MAINLNLNSNMGGVSLSVKEGDSQCTLKVGEGKDDDEYIITRHNQCEWLPKKWM